MNFSKGEENLMDLQVKAIADSGANVVVTGGKVADMALHYANKYNLMLVRWVLEYMEIFGLPDLWNILAKLREYSCMCVNVVMETCF